MVKRVKIHGLDVEYETVHRNVKYPRLEFSTGRLILILPKGYKRDEELIMKHKGWVYKKKLLIKTAIEEAKTRRINVRRSEQELKNMINSFAKEFSKELDVRVNKIYFRKLKSKWGSCSPKGNLTFNIVLRLLPKDLIKYVVFHEVVHLVEKRHKDKFWRIISEKFPKYEKNEERLLFYWFLVQEFIKRTGS